MEGGSKDPPQLSHGDTDIRNRARARRPAVHQLREDFPAVVFQILTDAVQRVPILGGTVLQRPSREWIDEHIGWPVPLEVSQSLRKGATRWTMALDRDHEAGAPCRSDANPDTERQVPSEASEQRTSERAGFLCPVRKTPRQRVN
jgi:hypothetical protein